MMVEIKYHQQPNKYWYYVIIVKDEMGFLKKTIKSTAKYRRQSEAYKAAIKMCSDYLGSLYA